MKKSKNDPNAPAPTRIPLPELWVDLTDLPFIQILSESISFFSWNLLNNLTQNSDFFGLEFGRDFYIKELF